MRLIRVDQPPKRNTFFISVSLRSLDSVPLIDRHGSPRTYETCTNVLCSDPLRM